jgi:hypothetical protein
MAWGQTCAKGAPGYFDYSTGVFRPVGGTEDFDSSSAAAVTPQTGTIVVNFTITIKSAIPATFPISCGATATVTEVSIAGVNIISDEADVVATRTGATAKCTVTIPYSWAVQNPATAKVSLNYTLGASKPTATSGFLTRLSVGTIASIPVPANGSTTTQTVNAVL